MSPGAALESVRLERCFSVMESWGDSNRPTSILAIEAPKGKG